MHPEERLHLMASAILYEYQDVVLYQNGTDRTETLNRRLEEVTKEIEAMLRDRLQLDSLRQNRLVFIFKFPWVLWISWIVTQKTKSLMFDGLAIAEKVITENTTFIHECALTNSSEYQESMGIKLAITTIVDDILRDMSY